MLVALVHLLDFGLDGLALERRRERGQLGLFVALGIVGKVLQDSS
jgi:hypothetical protein